MKIKIQWNHTLLALLLVLSGFRAQAGERNSREPLKYPSSLHSLAMLDNTKVSEALAGPCLTAVRNHLKSGQNFYSKTVVENSMPFEEFPRADVADNSFYHWTKAHSVLLEIAKNKTYGDLFSYPRERNENSYNWMFYVAADPKSSSVFGNHLYKFTLHKGTRVFFNQGDMPGHSQDYARIHGDIFRELTDRNDRLYSCQRQADILTQLSLEASNVSLIAYCGLDNSLSPPNAGKQWLQVVNAWAIKSMELVKGGNHGSK